MQNIEIPFNVGDIEFQPTVAGKVKVTPDMQRALSLLTGWDGGAIRVVKVTEGGVLVVTSPVLKAILNIEATTAAYNWQGSNIKCNEVLIKCPKTNTGQVWYNVYAAAAEDTGHPLEGQEWISFGLNNLNDLHLHIVNNGEKAIVQYG